MTKYIKKLECYLKCDNFQPLFLHGEAYETLRCFPNESIDFCMTSPPYWNQREYQNGGIGLETSRDDYIENLLRIFNEIKRVLKPTGSFWLNLGDTYENKSLAGMPWRIALAMTDSQNWILRNDVVWNKIKGPDNSKDKLRNIHEYIFHFVKHSKKFYYDVDSIRSKPRETQIRNGSVISATGVSGVRYKRQIELSTSLNENEKQAAFQTLNRTLEEITNGTLSDFRMVIRNQHRTTHSNSEKVSGRAKELIQRGFYILKYHPNGSKPSDVWEVLPENTAKRGEHYASYPEDLCKIPLRATCPPNGITLDPFCGTGTTNLVATKFSLKSIGIDVSQSYLDYASLRCQTVL